MRALLIVIAASLGGIACRDIAPPWPTVAWAESSPAAQGVDPAALAQLDSEFASGRYGYVNGLRATSLAWRSCCELGLGFDCGPRSRARGFPGRHMCSIDTNLWSRWVPHR
jgi:hypothetical protein